LFTHAIVRYSFQPILEPGNANLPGMAARPLGIEKDRGTASIDLSRIGKFPCFFAEFHSIIAAAALDLRGDAG
jgi:hypothetical protein